MDTWTKQELKLLCEYWPVKTAREMRVLIPGRSVIAIDCKAKKLRLKKKKERKVFSPDEIDSITKSYHNTRNAELAECFGCTVSSINNLGYRLRLKKDPEFIAEISRLAMQDPDHGGRKCCFKKGHMPFNKGKKMTPEIYEIASRTFFKKGNIPANHKPIGSERITKDGCIEVKTKESGRWERKHRVVWEKENGPIPAGCNIQFKDGNPQNIDITNLYMISRSNQITLNTIHRYPANLKKSIRLIRKLHKTAKHYETDQY